MNDIYNTVEEKIGRVFESYGRFVANHAVKVLVVTVVLNVAMGMGMLKMKRETNTDEVYFPMGKYSVRGIIYAIVPLENHIIGQHVISCRL